MVIYNPSSGQNLAGEYEEVVRASLLSRHDQVDFRQTHGAGDAAKFATEAARSGYGTLVVAGGDGTVSEAVTGLADEAKRPVIGILPHGTVNNLARMLGIPLDIAEAIDVLAKDHTQAIDIGQVNDRYFISTVSMGSVPESVQEVNPETKSKWGPLAYLFKGIGAFLDSNARVYEILADGERLEGCYQMLVVGMGPSVYGLEHFYENARLDDGKMHLLALKDVSILESLSALPEIFKAEKQEHDALDMISFQTAEISVVGEGQQTVTVDGDTGTALPLRLRTVPQHIQVLVP